MNALEAFTKRDTAKGRWAEKIIKAQPSEIESPRVQKIFNRSALSFADAEILHTIVARKEQR